MRVTYWKNGALRALDPETVSRVKTWLKEYPAGCPEQDWGFGPLARNFAGSNTDLIVMAFG